MKLAIITHVEHSFSSGKYFAYSPYVNEMNVWIKNVEEVLIVAPLKIEPINIIDTAYNHESISFYKISNFDKIGMISKFKTIIKLPIIVFQIWKAMSKADHIHLRCPGNVGLLGCVIQMFFPNKKKTAKYAGNWDPKSNTQPWTYRLQKWILSSTFLTKNMQVLVYGEWDNQTKNIKPFFTATYTESEKTLVIERKLDDIISFLFVGTLAVGKQPIYAVKLVEALIKKNINATLDLYGEGKEYQNLKEYIKENNLESVVFLKNNQTKEIVKESYKNSHFLILPSKSEGWPKVVAEAMFWGCIPIATRVSCVPNMLENGERGVLLSLDLVNDVNVILGFLIPEKFKETSLKAQNWSRKFTIDAFEKEIKLLLQP